MRSAETSGVGANGFGADIEDKYHRSTTVAQAPAAAPSRFKLSPITTAVALTSLIAATLFVIYDTTRTLHDVRRELSIIGTSLSNEMSDLEPEAIGERVERSLARYGTTLRASFSGATNDNAVSTLTSQTFPVGKLGSVSLDTAEDVTTGGLLFRGGGAFALAALVTGFTLRRRRRTDMPDLVQRQNYHTLAAAIPMGVACWTKAGELIVCNDQYRRRLDLTLGEVTYHAAISRLISGGYMKLLNDDDNNRLLELHREDGSCLMIDERPLGDGNFMTLVSDVTERKRTDTLLSVIREEQRQLARRYHEEKLKAEAASRSKTNFLAHLSHDIRTPLNHIIGFAELMRHQTYGPLGDARYDDYINSIKTSGEHLLASFATILDLAELEGGRKALRADPVQIDKLLESVVQRFKEQATRAGVRFQLRQGCGAVVEGDRLGLQRMLGNIVENSIRFTPTGGKITLGAFAATDGVVIEVTDTGIGMNEERLESLTQPFALGDATFTREGVGPGLGISISRAIAELSGGHMAIDSSPALGTTVAISLPLHVDANPLTAAAA